MARLRYVTPADSPDPERMEHIYSQIRAMGRKVIHLYQILANQPAALEAFLGMSRYIRDESSLRPALREMAILATGETHGLAPVERAVVTYALQVAKERAVDDAAFEELRSLFSDAEITDLVLTVAWYHLCAAVLGPLRVELEVDAARDVS